MGNSQVDHRLPLLKNGYVSVEERDTTAGESTCVLSSHLIDVEASLIEFSVSSCSDYPRTQVPYVSHSEQRSSTIAALLQQIESGSYVIDSFSLAQACQKRHSFCALMHGDEV